MEETGLGVRFVETQLMAALGSPCWLVSVCPRQSLLPLEKPLSEVVTAEPVVPAHRRGILADTSLHKREVVGCVCFQVDMLCSLLEGVVLCLAGGRCMCGGVFVLVFHLYMSRAPHLLMS